jgi:hypothetical protein
MTKCVMKFKGFYSNKPHMLDLTFSQRWLWGVLYNNVQSTESQLTFRKNMSPPSSGLKNKPSKKLLSKEVTSQKTELFIKHNIWKPQPIFQITTNFSKHHDFLYCEIHDTLDFNWEITVKLKYLQWLYQKADEEIHLLYLQHITFEQLVFLNRDKCYQISY